MKLRQLDLHDDAQFTSFYAIMRAADLYERAGMPFWSERECAIMFRHDEPNESWHAYAAHDGDEMVGISLMMLTLLDNTDMAFVSVAVRPERRRHGIGSALLAHVVEEAKAAGRTKALAETNIPFERRDDHPYRKFAEKHGFALANVEVRRVLELPVDDGLLQKWQDEAAPHHQGYRIDTFTGDIPEAILDSYVYLYNQLALDAPTGDLDFEAEAMTPEALRIREQKLKEMDRTVYTTVAIAPDGDAVAHTNMAVSVDDRDNVYQWGTLVRRDHRGHRLGMAVKAANLRALQRDFPDRPRIVTANSETNAPMVGINELMGFRPVELLAEFQLKFDGTS
ncbi:MAG: GNAT family N-acetyltransferase [Nocardioidaceae bacterium]